MPLTIRWAVVASTVWVPLGLGVASLALGACSGDNDEAGSVVTPAIRPTTSAPPAATTLLTTAAVPTAVPTSAAVSTTPATMIGESIRLGRHAATRIEVPFPDWLAADDSHVYAKLDSGEVARIDPATGAVVATAEIAGESGVSGNGCQGIGVGFDSVWTCYGADVVRMSLEPFIETARIPSKKTASQGHLATGFGRVWVLQGDGSSLVGIDPSTEDVETPMTLPVRGTDLAVTDDAIWIVSAVDDAVIAVDPDGTTLHRIDGLAAPTGLAVTGEFVWVGADDAVHKVDRTTGTIVATVVGGVGQQGALAAAADDAVWVRNGAEVRLFDATGSEIDMFTLPLEGPSPGDVLLAFGSLWTSASEHSAIFVVRDR